MKPFIIFIFTFFLLLFSMSYIKAYGVSEEVEGKIIWEKLQAKQLECKNLTDDNFELLGEYFMGRMAGSSHEAMNTMMEQMMGKEREEQMHIVMGKRMSDCDTSAAFPSQGVGFMSMMNMMTADPVSWFGFGWLSMLIFWILLILGVVALIRYLGGSRKRNDEGRPPLDILKGRYARGEIDKKEFEEIKKDLR